MNIPSAVPLPHLNPCCWSSSCISYQSSSVWWWISRTTFWRAFP